jgi:hypothetical protein
VGGKYVVVLICFMGFSFCRKLWFPHISHKLRHTFLSTNTLYSCTASNSANLSQYHLQNNRNSCVCWWDDSGYHVTHIWSIIVPLWQLTCWDWGRVQILPGPWMSVPCECCVLSGRGLCISLITHPEECDRDASTANWPWLTRGCCVIKMVTWQPKDVFVYLQSHT